MCSLGCNRLLDGQDQQVAPSALSEFRAGVRACSPPLTEHILALMDKGLVWHSLSASGEPKQVYQGANEQVYQGTRSRITCVSSLRQALHPSFHLAPLPARRHSFLAHQTLWADEESFAAVMAFANYRRSLVYLCNCRRSMVSLRVWSMHMSMSMSMSMQLPQGYLHVSSKAGLSIRILYVSTAGLCLHQLARDQC